MEHLLLQYHSILAALNSNMHRTAATSAALAFSLSLSWLLSDFHAWKAFGTGGTPPTWAGYWRMTNLRIGRLLLFGGDDLRDASRLSGKGPRYLDPSSLSMRQGATPRIVSRTMPQRQVPYKPIEIQQGVSERLESLITTVAAKYPDRLELRPSKTEGGTALAIYAKENLPTIKDVAKTDQILGTEIAHVHPAEGSLHVWLTEADAKTVVEKKWGMRFPLNFVDKGFIMIYSPRTIAEVEVAEMIVKAGVANVTGTKA
jgi:hypothetical protein